jgi:uncharacterized protein with beta-barrel porin domain
LTQFNCYRGDVDNIAITEDGSFFVTDTLGRNWICHEVPTLGDPTEAAFQDAFDMMAVQQNAHKAGVSLEGTQFIRVDCSRSDLSARLSNKS